MLFYYRRENGCGFFCDVDGKRVDSFYHFNISFDRDNPAWHTDRFIRVLDVAALLLGDGKRKKLKVHTAIHSLLFIDSLLDDFVDSWKRQFADALDDFLHKLNVATRNMKRDPTAEYWARYGAMARTDSSSKDVLEQRHHFFIEKMMENMGPLQRKDPVRLFSSEEKELIYYSNLKNCARCGLPVEWEEAEIHHSTMHSLGGSTSLDNGILLHRACHRAEHAQLRLGQKEDTPESRPQVPWEDSTTASSASYASSRTAVRPKPDISLEYCFNAGLIENGARLRYKKKGFSVTAIFIAPASITQGATGFHRPANTETLAQLSSAPLESVLSFWEIELADGTWKTLDLLRGLGSQTEAITNISDDEADVDYDEEEDDD